MLFGLDAHVAWNDGASRAPRTSMRTPLARMREGDRAASSKWTCMVRRSFYTRSRWSVRLGVALTAVPTRRARPGPSAVRIARGWLDVGELQLQARQARVERITPVLEHRADRHVALRGFFDATSRRQQPSPRRLEEIQPRPSSYVAALRRWQCSSYSMLWWQRHSSCCRPRARR
jgi:hypothetical protein